MAIKYCYVSVCNFTLSFMLKTVSVWKLDMAMQTLRKDNGKLGICKLHFPFYFTCWLIDRSYQQESLRIDQKAGRRLFFHGSSSLTIFPNQWTSSVVSSVPASEGWPFLPDPRASGGGSIQMRPSLGSQVLVPSVCCPVFLELIIFYMPPFLQFSLLVSPYLNLCTTVLLW